MEPTTEDRRPLRAWTTTIPALSGVSGWEVYTAYRSILGCQPPRDRSDVCVYRELELTTILRMSICDADELMSLKSWKEVLPLSASLTNPQAIKRLARIGGEGWLSRCSYNGKKLLLAKEDAEQLCFVQKKGFARPARWQVPVSSCASPPGGAEALALH